MTRWTIRFAVAFLMIAGAAAGPALPAENILKMSTTTSTQASGLLDVLLPALEEETGIRVKVFAKGTGAAIRDIVNVLTRRFPNVTMILCPARVQI